MGDGEAEPGCSGLACHSVYLGKHHSFSCLVLVEEIAPCLILVPEASGLALPNASALLPSKLAMSH